MLLACLSLWQKTVWAAPLEEPQLRALSQHPTWRRLLHYEADGGTSVRSAIHSDSFFLSSTGASDPAAELAATLAALRAPVAGAMDNHAQCRFPARYQWLLQQTGAASVGPDLRTQCPQLNAWTRGFSVKSLSVVFASGFLGNPASYFGHTLLKFNFEKGAQSSYLIDESVNYGALVPAHENPVRYIVYGLFGGYDGGFSHIGFYFHNHNYGNQELRDQWEYRLGLTQNDVDLVVNHAWEVMGKRYQYFFLGRNCAFRMAELIEVVEGVHAQPTQRPWTIPQAHLQTLARANYQGRPLVREVIFHPSRQTRFYGRLSALPSRDQAVFKDIVAHEGAFADTAFPALDVVAQQAVTETLLDYYQFAANPLSDAPASIQNAYARALNMRFALPPGPSAPRPTTPAAPHMGRAPSWVQLAAQQTAGEPEHTTLRIRPAYYDQLDAEAGHIPNSVLSMADVTLETDGHSSWLKKLDFINIESAGSATSGLPGDNGESWKLRGSLEQLDDTRNNHLIGKLSGDWGRSWTLGQSLYLGAFVGGAMHSNSVEYGVGYTSISMDAGIHLGENLGARLALQRRFPLSGDAGAATTTEIEIRQRISDHADIRAGYARQRLETWRIGWGWYW